MTFQFIPPKFEIFVETISSKILVTSSEFTNLKLMERTQPCESICITLSIALKGNYITIFRLAGIHSEIGRHI